MKRCTISLLIREIEIKVTDILHLLERLLSKRKELNTGEAVEKRESLCVIGWI